MGDDQHRRARIASEGTRWSRELDPQRHVGYRAGMSTETLISQRLPAAADFRQRLHRIPELSFEEFKTAETIRAELDQLKIEYTDGIIDAPTATIAMIGDT